ncbi:UNVERIFIED_CONTAM: hypothetical protein DES50_101251 [Williamsia faeni]
MADVKEVVRSWRIPDYRAGEAIPATGLSWMH